MKCETACQRVSETEFAKQAVNAEGRVHLGRGFRDEREYLDFVLERERAWERDHLWCGSYTVTQPRR